MKPLVFLLLGACSSCGQPKQTQSGVPTSPPANTASRLTIEPSSGGTVTTPLNYGIAVNKASTLNRRWFTINDPAAPITLTGAGIQTRYDSERYGGSYTYVAAGEAKATKPLRAVDIVFVIFDIWGDRMQNLSSADVADYSAGQAIPFTGKWRASETDVAFFFTSVAFVDQAMLADGTIWRADRKAVAEKVREVQLRISEAGLDREPPKEPKK